MISMCDKKTRTWCCRISLLFTILGVLCTMIFQIWSYYFLLVQQMDDITINQPILISIIKNCRNESFFQWNANCSLVNQNIECVFNNINGNDVFVQQNGIGLVTHSLNKISIRDFENCIGIMVWALPWL